MSRASVEAFNLKKGLNDAFKSVGIKPVYSKEHLAKVLAYLYIYGGGNEAVVYNVNLNSSIRLAQEEFSIKGGCIPDAEGVKLIQQFVRECATGKAYPWIKTDLLDRYNLGGSVEMYSEDLTKYYSELREKRPKSIRKLDLSILKAFNLV